jgi:hypothetical protein
VRKICISRPSVKCAANGIAKQLWFDEKPEAGAKKIALLIHEIFHNSNDFYVEIQRARRDELMRLQRRLGLIIMIGALVGGLALNRS